MKGINKFYFFFASLVFIMTACEGGTTFTKFVTNNSSEIVTLELFTVYGGSEEIAVNPSESKTVFWDDQVRTFTDDSYTCTNLIDSIHLSISNGKTLVKDIMDPNNWIRETKGGRNAKENCTFTISNNDLQ